MSAHIDQFLFVSVAAHADHGWAQSSGTTAQPPSVELSLHVSISIQWAGVSKGDYRCPTCISGLLTHETRLVRAQHFRMALVRADLIKKVLVEPLLYLAVLVGMELVNA